MAIDLSTKPPAWAASLLEHCVFTDETDFSQRLPARLITEIRLFAEYVTALLERRPILPEPPLLRYSSMTVAGYWIRSGVRNILVNSNVLVRAGSNSNVPASHQIFWTQPILAAAMWRGGVPRNPPTSLSLAIGCSQTACST